MHESTLSRIWKSDCSTSRRLKGGGARAVTIAKTRNGRVSPRPCPSLPGSNWISSRNPAGGDSGRRRTSSFLPKTAQRHSPQGKMMRTHSTTAAWSYPPGSPMAQLAAAGHLPIGSPKGIEVRGLADVGRTFRSFTCSQY